MGGFGSGRPGRRVTIEGTASLVLDVDTLRRQRVFVPSTRTSGTLRIGNRLDVRFSAEIANPWEGWIVIEGEAETDAHGRFPIRQRIELTATNARFGGRRWWFRCPQRHVKARRLYLPNGATSFAGREALGLTYQSQREGTADRLSRRARKLHRRLGGDGVALGKAPPPRPKHMRQDRYEMLLRLWEDAESRALHRWAADALALTSRQVRQR